MIFSEHRGFWTPARRRSLYLGILLFVLAVVVNIALGRYSFRRSLTAPYASDILLDNLPVVDVDFIIVAGDIALWAFLFALLVMRPRYLLFGIKAVSLFIIIRSFFISLTHLGPYPYQSAPSPEDFGYRLYHLFTFQGNYFFSGHTSLPFLMALIFWDHPLLRRFCLFTTVLFGTAVLLAHVHYSIDVFAAPFIIYSIYALTAKLFPKDHELLAAA